MNAKKHHALAHASIISGLVWICICLLAAIAQQAQADYLAGDASAAALSPDGVRKNPANFAFISNGYFDMSPRLYEINSLFVRYPGFGTVPKETRGISPMSAMSFAPFSVDAAKSRLGFVLSEVLPPISVSLEVKRLPIIALDQLMFLNVKTKAQVRFGIGGAVAYRATERLGFGLSGGYRSISLHSSLRDIEDGDEIAALRSDLKMMNATIGVRYVAIPGRLAIGLSTIALSVMELKNSFEGGFADLAGDAGSSGATPGANTQFGKTFLAGIHYLATARLSLRSDIQYTAANPDERRFSIVDFEEQPLDSYDTLAFRLGAKFSLSDRGVMNMGYVYEPAAVGSGERGKGSTTGFGTIDYVPIFVGLDDLKPYHRVVWGIAQSFERKRGYDRWTVAGGLAYQIASLGIDADGELPGAYRQRKILFPVQVTYRY